MKWLLIFVLITTVVCNSGNYHESLEFTPLPRNNLLATFQFNVTSLPTYLTYYNGTDLDSTSHYSYFPRSIGPLLEKTNTRELHLRFTQGWWDSELWGKLPNNGTKSGGTGVEIWAIIESETAKDAMASWSKLAVSLSGFFCASLNFIDESITTFPLHVNADSFIAESGNKLFLLRAAMPAEPICTENLTPFVKLLPTRGKAGISSLLDGHRLFDSLWNSMSIDITTHCDELSSQCNLLLEQNINVVVDVMRSLRKAEEGAIPKPVDGDNLRCDKSRGYTIWQCFPLGLPQQLTYSVKDIFGRAIKGAPFVSQKTPVTVNFNGEGWKVKVSDGGKDISLADNDSSYEISGTDDVNIEFDASNTSQIVAPRAPPLQVSRSLTGYSQDKGGFRVVFENLSDEPVTFIYFESLPWFTRLYLSTLEASSKTIGESYKNVYVEDYVTLNHYQPAVDRKRPSHMELTITIPAHETLSLHYQFDKSLLLYAEYPPDANHGFSVEPAVITVLEGDEKVYELRTTSSLVTLPTPDFSMPYNVIILTGTVVSLAFGSIYNLLIKDVITEEEFERIASQTKLRKLLDKIRAVKIAAKNLLKR